MIGIYSKLFVFLLFHVIWSSTKAETKGRFDKGTIVVNLFDKKAKRSYLKYFKPDGFEHVGNSFNFTNWISGKEDEEFWGLTADFQAQKIFWNEFKQKRLYEYDARSGKSRAVIKYATAGLENLAYDRVTRVLYWTDSRMNAIFASEKTYKFITRVKSTGILQPRAIAVHTTRRKLIYSVFFLTVQTLRLSRIMKCDLDGKRERPIVAFPDVVRVVAIAIDLKGNRLLWVDQALDDTSIVQSSDLNGLSRSVVHSSKRSVFADITRYKHFYAVADTAKYKSRYNILIRYKKTSSKPTYLKTRLMPRNVVSFVNDESSNTLITNECARTKCNHICLASFKQKSRCKCDTGYRLIGGKTCVTDFVNGDHFLVLDRGNRNLFQFELTNVNEEKLSPKAYPIKGRNATEITAFAVDEISGDLLYYDAGRGVFVVWDKVELQFSEGNGYDKVLYMQVDSCNKILYWNTEHILYRWKINGNSFTIAHRTMHERVKINRFAVDLKRSSLFLTEFDERKNIGYVMQLNYLKDNVQRLYQTTEALHAIFVSREMNSLLVTAKSSGALISIDLETIHNGLGRIHIYKEDLTDYVNHITSIQDFVIVNEQMYLVDRQWASLLRLTWKGAKLQSVDQYGRDRLFFPTVLAFVNQTKLFINSGYSSCRQTPKPTETPTVATTRSDPMTSATTSSTTTTAPPTTKTARPTATFTITFTSPTMAPTTTTSQSPITTRRIELSTTPLRTAPKSTHSTPTTVQQTSEVTEVTTVSTRSPISETPKQINSACDIILQFPGSEEEKQKAFQICRLFAVA